VEPISLILGALGAGALAAVQESAGQAVKDAYAAFKNLLRRRLSGNEAGEVALSRYEQQPEAWGPPLHAELTASGVDRDDEVLAAAQALLDQVRDDPAGARIFQNQFHGPVHGFVQGDHNQVTMTFDNRDRGD
jgi:hypothetical protein